MFQHEKCIITKKYTLMQFVISLCFKFKFYCTKVELIWQKRPFESNQRALYHFCFVFFLSVAVLGNENGFLSKGSLGWPLIPQLMMYVNHKLHHVWLGRRPRFNHTYRAIIPHPAKSVIRKAYSSSLRCYVTIFAFVLFISYSI